MRDVLFGPDRCGGCLRRTLKYAGPIAFAEAGTWQSVLCVECGGKLLLVPTRRPALWRRVVRATVDWIRGDD